MRANCGFAFSIRFIDIFTESKPFPAFFPFADETAKEHGNPPALCAVCFIGVRVEQDKNIPRFNQNIFTWEDAFMNDIHRTGLQTAYQLADNILSFLDLL